MKTTLLTIASLLLLFSLGCTGSKTKPQANQSTLSAKGNPTTDWRTLIVDQSEDSDTCSVLIHKRWLPTSASDASKPYHLTKPSLTTPENEFLDLLYLQDYNGHYKDAIDLSIGKLSSDSASILIKAKDFQGWIRASMITVPDQSKKPRMMIEAVITKGVSVFRLQYFGDGDVQELMAEMKRVTESFEPETPNQR